MATLRAELDLARRECATLQNRNDALLSDVADTLASLNASRAAHDETRENLSRAQALLKEYAAQDSGYGKDAEVEELKRQLKYAQRCASRFAEANAKAIEVIAWLTENDRTP
jgi:chromosome segregation ATPase